MVAGTLNSLALVDLRGQIERITYTNEENGYTIAKVKIYGRRDLVTVVGNFMAPMPGEILKMQGEWANHPKFGEHFKVVNYKSLVPAPVAGVENIWGPGLSRASGLSWPSGSSRNSRKRPHRTGGCKAQRSRWHWQKTDWDDQKSLGRSEGDPPGNDLPPVPAAQFRLCNQDFRCPGFPPDISELSPPPCRALVVWMMQP